MKGWRGLLILRHTGNKQQRLNTESGQELTRQYLQFVSQERRGEGNSVNGD